MFLLTRITFQKPNQMGLIGHVTLLTNIFANKDQSSTYIQENMNKCRKYLRPMKITNGLVVLKNKQMLTLL
jgi:hypothetical protein